VYKQMLKLTRSGYICDGIPSQVWSRTGYMLDEHQKTYAQQLLLWLSSSPDEFPFAYVLQSNPTLFCDPFLKRPDTGPSTSTRAKNSFAYNVTAVMLVFLSAGDIVSQRCVEYIYTRGRRGDIRGM
jgi:hypothetical protein